MEIQINSDQHSYHENHITRQKVLDLAGKCSKKYDVEAWYEHGGVFKMTKDVLVCDLPNVRAFKTVSKIRDI